MSTLVPVPAHDDVIDPQTRKLRPGWVRWLHELKKRAEDAAGPGGVIDAAQITSGVLALARLANIANAQIAAAAAIAWSKIDKAGSSLADLATRSASDLSSGTLPDGRFPATLPAASGVNLTNLDASDLASGTVPVARLGNGVTTAITSTATGTQNNWAPGLAGDTLISWSGASDLTVTGFAGGVSGQRITFKNTGSAVAYFAHQSGSSSAGNKLRNFVTSGNTPVAARGSAVFLYDGTDWRLVSHEQGAWIDIAYAAGNFTAPVGTWTVDAGDQQGLSFAISGQAMFLGFSIIQTDVSSTPGYLSITLPLGMTAAASILVGYARVVDAGAAAVTGFVRVLSAGTTLDILRQDVANFTTTAADNTTVQGSAVIPLT